MKLFKYFSTDSDKLERFVNGQVYLTPPKYFNDPWDFLVRCEPPTQEWLKENAPWLHPSSVPDFHSFQSTPTALEQEAGELQNGYSKVIGVVSLTELPLDRLMWAHYGECHQGFVAEFAHSEQGATEGGLDLYDTPFGPAAKVSYPPSLPVLKRDTSNMEETIFTKHICWNYEKEWRVIWPLAQAIPHPTKLVYKLRSFKPNQLLRIILGLRVTKEVKSSLCAMLNRMEYNKVIREAVSIDPNTRELQSSTSTW